MILRSVIRSQPWTFCQSRHGVHGVKHPIAALAMVAMMLASAGAHATVWIVTANPDATFTPSYLLIYYGDTVKFVNEGGLHNVHADDDRFICSLNCTTHNAPSTQAWQVTVRFNRLGGFGYYCDAHGDLNGGMRGMIEVIDRVFIDGFEGP